MTDANLRIIRNFCSYENVKRISSTDDSTGMLEGALFFRQFFKATVFLCRFFFQFTYTLFWVDFTNISIFLLYIMCISSKSQTVFWAQNFRDEPGSDIAVIAANCLIDGFSYSNNIFQNFYKEKCCMKWD